MHKSGIKIEGIISAKKYDQSKLSEKDKKHNERCEKLYFYCRKFLKFLLKLKLTTKEVYFKLDYKFNKMLQRSYRLGPMTMNWKKQNVVCNSGFQAMGQVLAGIYGDTGAINKMALGDGTPVTPSSSDTVLVNEVYRNDTASSAVSSNVLYLTAFYNETEVDDSITSGGEFTEFGNFIDGDAGLDTGSLWTHIATGGWTKTNTEVLVVDCQYTFTSS